MAGAFGLRLHRRAGLATPRNAAYCDSPFVMIRFIFGVAASVIWLVDILKGERLHAFLP